ncbi:hypothetical protein C8R45DRAFT_768631, partial [Mycena sanguinolenta]
KPAPVSVTAASLKDVFEQRLNPPETTPPQFDEAQLGINKLLAQLLPEKTEDHTPEGFFSGNWNEDDMGRVKDHLRSHSLQSADGEDQLSYTDLIEIPNDDLAYLYNHYRLVALESCFLKGYAIFHLGFQHILVHWRILSWAEARSLIPPSQNGFRPGYRTNNNPFILQCLKEWARAHGQSLYVACVDFTNFIP